ncbi:TetR/AcrR family transcriptional regulator [Mycolicibacterium sp. XJ1819]
MTHQKVVDVEKELGKSKAAARLRAAAAQMFAERGYGATSTRDIAAAVGLSPGAVYPHYQTKESLLYAISLEGHASALAAIVDVERSDATATERLRVAVSAYAEWHAHHNALARVVQYELRSLSPDHLKRIAAIRRRISSIFATILQTGVDSGEFHVDDIDAAVLAISSLCIDVSRWFPTRRRRDPQALAATYADLVLQMVGATKGAES